MAGLETVPRECWNLGKNINDKLWVEGLKYIDVIKVRNQLFFGALFVYITGG